MDEHPLSGQSRRFVQTGHWGGSDGHSRGNYKELRAGALEKPSKVLYGPSCRSLDVLGQFTATLQHGDYSSTQPIYVVRGLKSNLLGLPAIKSLHLLHRVDSTRSDQVDFRQRFPRCFKDWEP